MRIIAFDIIGILLLISCLPTQDKKKANEMAIEKNTFTQPNIQSNAENILAVRITNSGPRGGAYLNSAGTKYRYVVFRVQIINDTIYPINLDIKFPRNPISLLPDSTIELSVFLVPENFTPSVIKDTFNFGVDLEAFFESGDPRKFEFNSVIKPKKQSTFFVGMLFESETVNGVTRAQLAAEGHDESPHYPVESTVHYNLKYQPLNLIYGISFDAPRNYISIPCGQVRLK